MLTFKGKNSIVYYAIKVYHTCNQILLTASKMIDTILTVSYDDSH